MTNENMRRLLPWGTAILTIVGAVIAHQLTESLKSKSQSWGIVLAWMAAGIIVTYLVSRLQAKSTAEGPEVTKEWVSQLERELRSLVQARSYGARRTLIEAPLTELDQDITPRLGWVRDPRLLEPEPPSEEIADGIVAAFEASKRRLLIVGEPGSGKTMAAYSLIEYLDDEIKGAGERIPLLVNLSAWEGQDNFEVFLVDYLCSSVGYQVRQRAAAEAFVKSRKYSLFLDGLDEIPAELRAHLSESLDKFISGLSPEAAVLVTCRTKEYEELLDEYRKDRAGLGLVQAVEILPLTDDQLDRAFLELAKRDEEWEEFLSQRHLTAYQRVRHMLRTPLFLNLTVVGLLSPDQLLDVSTTEQELQDLVIDTYLDHTLRNQDQYEPADARRYLMWIARFLNGDEVAQPFGLKTSDATVFDFADLTPPGLPRRYRFFIGLVLGLINGLLLGLGFWLISGSLFIGLITGLCTAPLLWVAGDEYDALSTRLTFAWPATRQARRAFLHEIVRMLIMGLIIGLIVGLLLGLFTVLLLGLFAGVVIGLLLGLIVGLLGGLLDPQSVLITSRSAKATRSLSLINGLIMGLTYALLLGLVVMLFVWLFVGYSRGLVGGLLAGCAFGLYLGLLWGGGGGGWFVLLQKVAHRRLRQVGSLPRHPDDFLEWGIEQQIFRPVGGGVRFRHSLIQQHLANTSVSFS